MNAASPARLASLLVAFVIAAFVWSTTAQAQNAHSLSGNARFQIGNGLPIPIGGTLIPNGRVKVQANQFAIQGTGMDPKPLTLPQSGLKAPGNPIVLPVFLANSNVFQVRTMVPLTFPKAPAAFAAGGRTGASVVSFCPGDVVLPAGNPGCGTVNAGSGIHGRLVYTKTVAQFGGPAQGTVGGTADVALRVTSGAPCTAGVAGSLNPGCRVRMAIANPAPTGAVGAAFGFSNQTAGMVVPSPSGFFYATITGMGFVANAQLPGLGPGTANPVTEYGGPWSTGMVKISITMNVGPVAEIFTITGGDSRMNGVGHISLVAGSVAARSLSGPNSNRGWLNLDLGEPQDLVPALSGRGVAAFIGLLALGGAYALRRHIRS